MGRNGFLRYHLYFLSSPPATNPCSGGIFPPSGVVCSAIRQLTIPGACQIQDCHLFSAIASSSTLIRALRICVCSSPRLSSWSPICPLRGRSFTPDTTGRCGVARHRLLVFCAHCMILANE
jgi:hypothetical protein